MGIPEWLEPGHGKYIPKPLPLLSMGWVGTGDARPGTVNAFPQLRHLTLYILSFIAMVLSPSLSIAQTAEK